MGEIPTKSSSVILKLIRSPDDVLILETPYLRVIYDGELVEVKETSILVQRDLKGLCGTNNGDQRNDVLTPTSKVAPTYQAAAISHRVGKSCPSLTQQQRIYKEQLRFAKEPRIERSKVTQFLKSKLEKCSPRSTVTKPVPFTCLPATRERVIRLYEEKVRRGDILPELRSMQKSFTTKMFVPVSCTHPGL